MRILVLFCSILILLSITDSADARQQKFTKVRVAQLCDESNANCIDISDGLLTDTAGLSALTSAEVDQLENIGSSTVSATQWGYLGATDQGVATTDGPTFAGATMSSNMSIQTQGDLRLEDSSGGEYVAIEANATTTTYTLTMPAAQGAAGKVLQNDGSGALSWETVSAGTVSSSGNVDLSFLDNDTTDGDVNAIVRANCTDTGSGSEDCDVSVRAQVAGTEQDALVFDASDDSWTVSADLKFDSGDQILADTGSTSAPGISFASYPNYGIWASVNNLSFSVNGNEKFSVENSFLTTAVPMYILSGTDSSTVPTIGRSGDSTTGLGFNGNTAENVGLYSNSQIGFLVTDTKTAVQNSRPLHIEDQQELRLEDTSGGEYMGIRAPGTVTSSTTLTLPDGAGTSGQAMTTNGSGTLAWTSVAGANLSVASKTTTYTLTTSDDVIFADSSSGAFTLTLPTASGNGGKVFRIKKTDSTWSNAVTIDGDGSETVDGNTTFLLYSTDETLTIVSDGTNWEVLAHEKDTSTESLSSPSSLISNVTVGNGTVTAYVQRTGNRLKYWGVIAAGSTTSISGDVLIELPFGFTVPSWYDNGDIIERGVDGCNGAFHIQNAGERYGLRASWNSTDDDAFKLVTFFDQSAGAQNEIRTDRFVNASIPIAVSDEVSFCADIPISQWEQ